MTYNYSFHKDALSELENILDYITIELGNKTASNSLLDKIFDVIDNICLFPLSSPLAKYSNLQARNIRQATANNFSLFYLCDDKNSNIIILHIKYARSDLSKIT